MNYVVRCDTGTTLKGFFPSNFLNKLKNFTCDRIELNSIMYERMKKVATPIKTSQYASFTTFLKKTGESIN